MEGQHSFRGVSKPCARGQMWPSESFYLVHCKPLVLYESLTLLTFLQAVLWLGLEDILRAREAVYSHPGPQNVFRRLIFTSCFFQRSGNDFLGPVNTLHIHQAWWIWYTGNAEIPAQGAASSPGILLDNYFLQILLAAHASTLLVETVMCTESV